MCVCIVAGCVSLHSIPISFETAVLKSIIGLERHYGISDLCLFFSRKSSFDDNMLNNVSRAIIENSKRSYEQKLAFNIKHDTKSFYAYVRSKQKVQDKVGPLEDSDGNIITEGFLMAENLNEYFSSVFTREDISALPVPETKFEGRESDYLGQLIVTPKMVAKKIRDMKDNKSPGVDGIPPKLLLEIVEKISIPLATVFGIRGRSSSVRMKRSKHHTIILKRIKKQVREL